MKLHVTRLGSGFPLIILHGLYGSGDNWLTIARQLSAICEVFLVDQRNHGRSPHSPDHSYRLLAEDLHELMDDHDIDKPVILGHSMGGKAAMWFAAAYPSRISRLIVADISPRDYSEDNDPNNQAGYHRRLMESMLSVDFSEVTALGDIERQLEPVIPDKSLRSFLLKNVTKSERGNYQWRLNLPALLNNLKNLSGGLEEYYTKGFSFRQFPVLFIRGERSRYISEKDLPVIENLFPGAKVVTLQNAGHWLHAEQPEAFIRELRKEILTR